ncbi:MAG: Ig-like domain-containing protein [Candidatus Eisenbacteria bacterium]|nr:Ig-like domain-containing protein [Candidatus Eisenbacteria bacterium]
MRRFLAFLLVMSVAVAVPAFAAVPQTIVIDGVNDFLPANLLSDDLNDTQSFCGAGIFPMDIGRVYVTNDANFLYVGIEFSKTCFCDMNMGVALDIGTAAGGTTDPFGRKIGFTNLPFKPDWVVYDVTPTNCNTFNFEQIYENVAGTWQGRGTVFNPSYGSGSNGLGIFDSDTFKEFKLPLSTLGAAVGTTMHLEAWITQEGATKGPLDALSSDGVQLSTVSATTFDTPTVIELASMLPYTVLNAVDNAPPTVTSVNAVDFALQGNKQFALLTTKVDIKFSEPVDLTTAQTTANYVYGGPAPARTVTSAVRDALAPDVVHLTLGTPIAANATAYSITANGVKDLANNTIVSNGTTNKGSFFLQRLDFNGRFALGLCSGTFAPTDTFAVEGNLAPLSFGLCDNGLMYDANADSVYTLSVPFSLAVNPLTGKGEADLEWKFSNKCNTYEPLGSNRAYHLTSDSGAVARLTEAWNNDDPSNYTNRAVDVIFKVNAAAKNPIPADVVTLLGDRGPLSFTQPGVPMLDNGVAPDEVAGDKIYTARVTFPKCSFRTVGWKVDFNGTFECAGQGNRSVFLNDALFSSATPIVLPARGINRCEVSDKPLTVVFSVRADQFYPPSSPADTVAIRGDALPFDFGVNAVVLRDDGVSPDSRANDGVFTRSVTFPDSTKLRSEFKYWTAGDFECAGFGNRVLVLDDVANTGLVPIVRLQDVYDFCTELAGVGPGGNNPGGDATFAALRPVVPNPVSRSARFAFDLHRAGRVALDVFDITGRRVSRVIDSTLEPGTHSFAWDGRDARGVRLGPGLYIYQLSMAGERVSRRLIMTH